MAQAKVKSALAPEPSKAKSAPPPEPSSSQPPAKNALAGVREWTDALVIAFLLAMFIRTFAVELFKIPSGSMTPTLVGTGYDSLGNPAEYVVEWDVSRPPTGQKDLIIDRGPYRRPRYHIFYKQNGRYLHNVETDELRLPPQAIAQEHVRNDRIIVSKFIYWFRQPRRGEIVVFRVPASIYLRDKPIYIKRLVGLPGDLVEIHHPHVYVNGEQLTQPEIFADNEYVNKFGERRAVTPPPSRPACIKWHDEPQGFYVREIFDSAKVPPGGYFMMGDNSKSSRDSRDWGAVPESNLKGKAVFRYWPWRKMRFLN